VPAMTTAILLDALGRHNLYTANAKERTRDRTQRHEGDEYKAEHKAPEIQRFKNQSAVVTWNISGGNVNSTN